MLTLSWERGWELCSFLDYSIQDVATLVDKENFRRRSKTNIAILGLSWNLSLAEISDKSQLARWATEWHYYLTRPHPPPPTPPTASVY